MTDRILPDVFQDDSGQRWVHVCGYLMQGMVLSFPCCKEPNHEGDHAFARYHAAYVVEPDTGRVFEAQG